MVEESEDREPAKDEKKNRMSLSERIRYEEAAKLVDKSGANYGYTASIMREMIQNAIEGKDFEERREITEVEGDPKVGVIRYIRNVHKSNLTDQSTRAVDAYGKRVFQELTQLKSKYIFDEGFPIKVKNFNDLLDHQEVNPKDPEAQRMLATAKQFFGLHAMSPEQLPLGLRMRREMLLEEWGPEISYVLGNPDVEIHGVETDLVIKGMKLVRLPSSMKHNKAMAKLNEERERTAINTVMTFLKSHPGASVDLIFGCVHEFGDDVKKLKNPPVLKTISFPASMADTVREDIMSDENTISDEDVIPD